MKTSLTTKLRSKAGMADAGLVINRAAELAKDGNMLTIADGEYFAKTKIDLKNKGIIIEGAESTRIITHHKQPQFFATRNQGGKTLYLRNIEFENRNSDGEGAENNHGIVSQGMPINIEGCTILNVWGNGIQLTGDVASSPASNVSFAFVARNLISYCRKNGIYIRGGDSNASTFLHNDIRDCFEYGTNDGSYLGCHHISTMAHNNRRGNYIVPAVGSRSTFTCCYSEGGSPISYFHGHCRIYGGLWDSGVILESGSKADIVEEVNPYSRIQFDTVNGRHYSIWHRQIQIDSITFKDGYQWRLYEGDNPGIFSDKSDSDFNTPQEAIDNVLSKLNVK